MHPGCPLSRPANVRGMYGSPALSLRQALTCRGRVRGALAGLLLAQVSACTPEATVGVADAEPTQLSLYETFELSMDGPSDHPSPFTEYAEVTFRRGATTLRVDGFYDGDGTWRARFCPELAGDWSYHWKLGEAEGRGALEVSATPQQTLPTREEPNGRPHRGHVRRAAGTSLGLEHADGSPHYLVAGKWLSAKNYGPPLKNGEDNDRQEDDSLHDAFVTDERLFSFLDTLRAHGLNGVLLKVGLYPLEDDGITWDLDWIRRADRWIAAMNERGIYCQINLFDPWSRRLGSAFEFTTDSRAHVLDAWAEGREAEKENYVRYLVARFAGYDNVTWELGNRVLYPGLRAETFIAEANLRYVPWLRKYDPYQTAIALSDVAQAREVAGIDVEEPRFNTDLPGPLDAARPRVVNELVHDCVTDGDRSRAYLDATIRSPEFRRCYREANWIAFTSGATGSAAASWLDLSRPLNTAAKDVFADLGRMKRVIDQLPLRYDQLSSDTTYLVRGEGHRGTLSLPGYLYVSYFAGPSKAGTLDVSVPSGTYTLRWLDPTRDAPLLEEEIVAPPQAGRQALSLPRPAVEDDAVLLLIGPVRRPIR